MILIKFKEIDFDSPEQSSRVFELMFDSVVVSAVDNEAKSGRKGSKVLDL